MRTFQLARNWNIQPMDLVAVHHGLRSASGGGCGNRAASLDAEINVSLIVAEAALLGCFLLLSSDGHLREMDFERLTFEPGKAVGTAEYAKHAKTERVGEEGRFTQRVNDLVSLTPFPLRIWRISRFELPDSG